ncbi:MAG: PfkB family carbohydrate kinase, partial [Acetobacteraceae bacterium]
SLSDPFCVDRHRGAFRELVRNEIDILFANEAEVCSLYEVNEFDAAVPLARGDVALACLTLSERGSLVLRDVEQVRVAAAPVQVIDTTGAGDAYAAGFLAAYAAGRDLPACGALASRAAAAVIGQVGARPRGDLRRLIGSG